MMHRPTLMTKLNSGVFEIQTLVTYKEKYAHKLGMYTDFKYWA